MMHLQSRQYWEKLKAAEDNPANIESFWAFMTDYQKHIAAIYTYRLKTEPSEELKNYLETYRFYEMGLNTSVIPSFLTRMDLKDLYKFSYEVLGKKAPRLEK